MDVIEASHFQQVKDYLNDNPWLQFKFHRIDHMWHFAIVNLKEDKANPEVQEMWIGSSFGEGLKYISQYVGEQKDDRGTSQN